MKKSIILFLITCGLPVFVFSQYNEAGAFVGTSNYFGDLQTGMEPSEYHLSFGVFGRRHFSKHFATKVHFYKGTVSGTDANQRLNSGWRERNLNFRSTIMELAVQGEVNLTPFAFREDKGSAVYAFLGVAGFYFNPQAQMEGDWYDLQPLGTEGQGLDIYPERKKYNKINLAIPAGIGIRFCLNERTTFGFEIGVRRTFTDYLDDVSTTYPDIEYLKNQDPIAGLLSFRSPEYFGKDLENPVGNPRGTSTSKDWYIIGGFSVSVNLINDKYDLEWEEKYKIFQPEYEN